MELVNYRRLLVMYKLEDYKEVQSFIETYISSGLAKEMILKLDANFITPLLKRGENYQDVWNSLVEEYFALHATIDIIKLGRNRSEINVPTNRGSSWKNYERKLEKQGWNQISIETLKKSTVEILSYLSNSRESNGISKGLVLGNVQSGKTANMSGVISMAADLGYNFFIVLSGTIENLRNQTANRLYNDVRETSNLTWRLVDRPSLRSNLPDQKISKFLLNENDKDRYLTVCLKNKSRLENLIRWLYSDENKTRQLKVLVIDDEADQASVNTNKIEEQDPTKINKLIKELVNKGNVKAMNYIAYTATPYANILNETANDSLYPKDFIVVLPKSTDYIGPEEMFGTSEPEQVQKVDIVREISDYDVQVIRGLGKGEAIQIPKSLEEAIDWFIISTGAMRHLGYRKPISMLIHTSFKVNDHESIAKIVTSYVKKIRNNPSEFFSKLEILYMNEKIDFSRQRFLDNMENYSSPDAVPAYPNWVDIREQIERIFRLDDNEYLSHVQLTDNGEPKYHEGFHIAIDNSKMTSADEMIRLVYPSSVNATKLAPAFIVIGGNTLSRGLTIEGLVSTFFLRNTNQADTLMQMGRWFGYRKGYEIFPRVWMEYDAYERFQFLSQLDYELRANLAEYSERNLTPIEVAPKIKNSPDYQLVKITSVNKMQSAISAEFNFSGFNSQTIYFKDDTEQLVHNFRLTKKFLNSLGAPQKSALSDSKLVWKEVDSVQVEKFLQEYQVISEDIRMATINNLIEWLKENNHTINDWNIVLSSKGRIEFADVGSDWNIHGYNPKGVTRTKLVSSSKGEIVSIGVLRQPDDLIADIEDLNYEDKKAVKMEEIRSLRDSKGFGKTPLLVIYRIDKDSEPANKSSNRREKLNFSHDIIGINILIPSFIDVSTKNITTQLMPLIKSIDD
ncbi:Conserved uncharacterized protein [Streptococcus sanguinis SK36]|uniref:Conserved uncharacterized protein n=2 Tax=Streptococcus sanguinis TaxID=1305 RepID=A3CPU4_STRSV|nr:Conserved uncharacterized protein [Streptococcus sanguinis SK36]